MIILFTGHRNKLCDESDLADIHRSFPDATWLHGGAIGFDTQVENYAVAHGIHRIVMRPNYELYKKAAPLRRNDEMVEMCDLVFALYDFRESGGTYYTIKKAEDMDKQVLILEVKK